MNHNWIVCPFLTDAENPQKAFSAGDVTGPRVQTSAGACPALPQPFYLPFNTLHSSLSLGLSTTLKRHTLWDCEHTQCMTTEQTAAQTPITTVMFIKYTSAYTHTHTCIESHETQTKNTPRFFCKARWRDCESCILFPNLNQFKRKNVPGIS